MTEEFGNDSLAIDPLISYRLGLQEGCFPRELSKLDKDWFVKESMPNNMNILANALGHP